jgi:hypothetical protein
MRSNERISYENHHFAGFTPASADNSIINHLARTESLAGTAAASEKQVGLNTDFTFAMSVQGRSKRIKKRE